MKILNSVFGKLAILLGSVFFGATQALADVTMGADGSVTGTFNISPVFAVASAIFIALGGMVVVRWCIGFIRRG
jgi:hypothetical protein|nr:hypothetical protein [uncultured Campylobacter sp.]